MAREAGSWGRAAAGAGALLLAVVAIVAGGCSCDEMPLEPQLPGTELCSECFELWVWRENWDSADVHIYQRHRGASPENRLAASTWELDKSGDCFIDGYLTPEECAAETKSAREDGMTYTFAAGRNGEELDTVTFTVRLGDLSNLDQVKYTEAWTGSARTMMTLMA